MESAIRTTSDSDFCKTINRQDYRKDRRHSQTGMNWVGGEKSHQPYSHTSKNLRAIHAREQRPTLSKNIHDTARVRYSHPPIMSLVNFAHVCSHLQNASMARLGITSIPYTKLHLSFVLLLQRQGFISSVKLAGHAPPTSNFEETKRTSSTSAVSEALNAATPNYSTISRLASRNYAQENLSKTSTL